MSSFEPVILLYGSPTIISTINIRLPVSALFAFNLASLEQIVNQPSQLSQSSLHRYFVILLESIDDQVLTSLKSNHRVVSVYERETMHDYNQEEVNRMINSFRQITLDLSNDIVKFLTIEGEKQLKLERIDLVKIYYQQARVIKEWMMAFFRAEPSNILIIPLNSNQQNLDDAQQQLRRICQKLGYESTVIRQFHDYLPLNERHSSLLPYSQLLFNNEDPQYICKLINKLSPIRFYLYGNELCDINGWTKIMIEHENEIMDDEDNWIAFLENEFVDTDIKWNFAFTYGKTWKVSRVSPINFNQLEEDPRFRSAVRRSHLTYAERQIEVTAQIYDWYEDCLKRGYLHIQPKLSENELTTKSRHRPKSIPDLWSWCRFHRLCSFDYPNYDSPRIKSVSFIWLDELLCDCDGELNEIIKPYYWEFFNDLCQCVSFIEKQIRQQRYIFFIVSGTFGQELYSTAFSAMKQIFATYIYCSHLGPHIQWTKSHSQIHGVYNDSKKLAQHLKRDYDQLKNFLGIDKNNAYTTSIISQENKMLTVSEHNEGFLPLPITVYDSEQADLFFGHQRTIDTLLCMPHTDESKSDMINEFRRIYHHDQTILDQIDHFKQTYEQNIAVYWYTRDSFIGKTINQALRLSDVDTMFKLRHILIDINAHLDLSYQQSHHYYYYQQTPSEVYYRGQLMSNKEFDYFKQLRGSIISINTFLSTTTSMQVALMYAGKYHADPNITSVVFNIEKHSSVTTRPYANIRDYSLFPDEDETLFAMGSVFRIGNIRQLPSADNIWIIQLIITDQQDERFVKNTTTTTATTTA